MSAVPKSKPALTADRFGRREFKQNDFVVDLPDSVTLDEALDPTFWVLVADQMQPMDDVIIRAEDGSWKAYAVVEYCERNFARLVIDHVVTLRKGTTVQPVENSAYFVKWRGPHYKHCVIRRSDNEIIRSGEITKEDALQWLINHEKTVQK